jgi:hypothetical protein
MNEAPHRLATPALDALAADHDTRQLITGFIEWLHEQGLAICESNDGLRGVTWWPRLESAESLTARHLGIDLQQVERERRALLESLHRP